MRNAPGWIFCCFVSAPLFPATPAPVSPPNESIRAELTRQVPNCDTVAENAARLLLTKPGPDEAVVREWKYLCANHTLYILHNIASRLEQINAASADLNGELWATLNARKKYAKFSRPQSELSALLSRTAARANPESEDGKLLKTWFTAGQAAFRAQVSVAKKSRLYTFYRAEHEAIEQGISFSMGFTAGAWLPTGNLSRLGNHPSIGFNMLFGYGHFYFGLVFDFRFVNAPTDYSYFNPNTNTIERTSTFFSLFFGPDFRWEVWQGEQFSAFLLAGMGYDMLTHYAAQRYSRERPAFSDSLNLNAGLGFRYYFSETKIGYLDLELRYHYVDYGNGGKGGDDLSGRYFTALLAIGYKLSFEGP